MVYICSQSRLKVKAKSLEASTKHRGTEAKATPRLHYSHTPLRVSVRAPEEPARGAEMDPGPLLCVLCNLEGTSHAPTPGPASSKRSVGHLGQLSPPFQQKCHGCWKYLMVAALSFHFQQQTGVNASPASVSGLQRKLHCAYAAHNTLRILETCQEKSEKS